jgi:CheY-like chemotaxis protein
LRTILYFEDNPEQLALVASLLSRRPQVKLLSSPQAKLGIELARAHRPDMILLDLSLPDMNGLDLVRSLRAYPETREIPVVALSTNTLPEEIRRAKEAGFQDYLTKPINVNEFLDYIDRMLIAEPDRSIWRAP